MKALKFLSLCALAVVVLAASSSAGPIYRTKQVFASSIHDLFPTSFNNEDDVLGNDGLGDYFVYHLGVYELLPLAGAPEIAASTPNYGGSAMNNPDANGVVLIVGEASVTLTNSDGVSVGDRGACWIIPASTNSADITEESMPNISQSDGSETPGGLAVAINDLGEAVGNGFWQPNGTYRYGNAQFESYHSTAVMNAQGIDNSGDYLTGNWTFDAGLPTQRSDTLVGPTAGELPDVDSSYGTNNFPTMIRGGFVIGSYGALDSRTELGYTYRAFVWQVGDALLTELPDPADAGFANVSAVYSIARSVNNSGDVVGEVDFPDGSGTSGFGTADFAVLWKRGASGGYTAYALDNLVEDQYMGDYVEAGRTFLINDNDEIAMESQTYSQTVPVFITVLAPAGGAITISSPNPVDQANGLVVPITFSLQRSDDYNGPVSVQYATSDGAAVANVRYVPVQGTVTWAAGDSADQNVNVSLIPIYSGVPEEDFTFTISNPSGALISDDTGSNLDIVVLDDGGTFAFADTNYFVADNLSSITVNLFRTGGTDGAATLYYYTSDGTATAGTGYTAASGTITWVSGDASTKQINIPIANLGPNVQNSSFLVTAYIQSAGSGTATMSLLSNQTTVTITPAFSDSFSDFSYQTIVPYQSGMPWTFTIAEPATEDMTLQVQSSTDNSTWADLGGGQMLNIGTGAIVTDPNANWGVTCSNVTIGDTVFFRVVARVPNYSDQISEVYGPFNIIATLPTENSTLNTPNTALGTIPGAVGGTPINLILTGAPDLSDTVTLGQQTYSASLTVISAVVQIPSGQTTSLPGLIAAQNATITGGGATIIASVSLLTQDGGSIVSSGAGNAVPPGGSLAANPDSAHIVSSGAGNIVSSGAGNLHSLVESGIVSSGAGNILPEDGGAPAGQDTPLGSPPLIQPAYTGVITIDGTFSQFAGSSLLIAIAGTNTANEGAQQFDQLWVNGQANLVGGRIAFGFFNPTNQTDRSNLFLPPAGSTFDVIVATNIVLGRFLVQGPVWNGGLFFSGAVVTRNDGLQAVRLTAFYGPAQLFIQKTGPMLQLSFDANYTGYAIQSSPSLSSPNWTTIANGTNLLLVAPGSSSQFFRLSQP